MKKNIWNMMVAIFLLIGLSSMRSFAEGENEIRLDKDGTVTIISSSAAEEGISSLQFSVTVDAGNAERVEFAFDESNAENVQIAEITEYRYNKDEKKLNIYVAGTKALFPKDTNTLKVGKVMVLDGEGKDVAATVSVIADSLQCVYGTELKSMESVTVPEPTRIHDNGGSQGSNPSSGDDSQGSNPSGGDNSQGNNSQGGNDSQGDNDDDDDDSSNSESQGTVPSQGGTNQGQRPGSNGQGTNGTQVASNRPQGGNQNSQGNGQGTNESSHTSGSATVNTPAATTTPTAEPAASSGNSSGEASQPSSAPEMLPAGGGNQDRTESTGGINWILVMVVITVVLLVGVGVMAVVVLNGKPKSKQQDDFYDER